MEPFDHAKSAADFDPFFESPDINVFADEFECAIRGSGIEREKSVAIVVV